MTELSPRLGLTIPKDDGSDAAVLDDLLRALGLDIENKAPGITAMTTAARTALTGAAMFNGRVVYDTDLFTLFRGDGTSWRALAMLDANGHLPMSGKKATGLADGTAAGDAATKGQLDIAMPVGSITAYGGTAAPSGWLLCDGSAVSRTTYAGLFAALGTAHGAGNGTTTFNVPDLRGRAPIGVGTGSGLTARAVADKPGAEAVQLTANESGMPMHSHGVTDPGHSHAQKVSAGISDNGQVVRRDYASDGPGTPYPQGVITDNNTTGLTVNNSGTLTAAAAHNNMQPSYALHFIIKAT